MPKRPAPHAPTAAEVRLRLYGSADPMAGAGSPDPQGWNSRHRALAAAVDSRHPKAILEIGVWKGMSLVHLAKLAGPDCATVGVDTFLGSQEHWVAREGTRLSVPRRPDGFPDLWSVALANVRAAGVDDRVVLWPLDSRNAVEAAFRMGWEFGVAHVDASHSRKGCLDDLRLVQAVVARGGAIVVDDYDFPTVREATEEFCSEFGVKCEDMGKKALVDWDAESVPLDGLLEL